MALESEDSQKSIIDQINLNSDIAVDGNVMKPLLCDSNRVGSLESRLLSKGRQLRSKLSHSTKRGRESILKKYCIMDVKQTDTIEVDVILKELSSVNDTVEEYM